MKNVCNIPGCDLIVHAKSMCNRHYIQMKRHKRTRKDTFIENLEGESWRAVAENSNYHISDRGRVKSNVYGRHKLSATHLCHREGKSDVVRVRLGRGYPVHVAKLVAERFCENRFNDARIIYIDGNSMNCCAGNVAWIGTHYYGIAEKNLLEESRESELAGDCLKFMQGDSEALNGFFERKTKDLRSLAYHKNEAMIGTWKKTSVDIYSVVNEALMLIFRAIRRGLLRTSKKIDAWCWVITRNLLCNVVNSGLWEVSMTQKNRDGEEYNLIDLAYQGHS